MPEPGFAWALYYQVTRQPAAAKQAIDWALGNSTDLRQLALVFDWCGPAMTPAQSDRLAAKIQTALAKPAATSTTTSAAKMPVSSPPSLWPTACRIKATPS